MSRTPECRWILAFDASCGRCRAIATGVEGACRGRLEVLPLAHPEVRAWRGQSIGAEAPWAPTLLRVCGEAVDAWTGPALAMRLMCRLGARSTWRVLRVLGRLRQQEAVGASAGNVMGRGKFLRLGAGGALTAGLVLVGKTPAFAQPQRSAAQQPFPFYDCTGKPDGN